MEKFMKISIEIADEAQIKQLEALRGDKSAKEFAALCFAEGLKLADIQRRQFEAAKEIGKHPLLQFPETKAEFKSVEAAVIEATLKENKKENPIVAEVARLVTAYMAQLGAFAAQNANRLPPAIQVEAPTPIQQAALQITMAAVRAAQAKPRKAA
jgi:hypothetical protein